jgi:hypothetical protein
MAAVVAVHNNMNEMTWKQVMEWEKLHPDTYTADPSTGLTPKLLRFIGRPDELSLKARVKSLVAGHSAPFDRHDWVVDRGGKEVRYIIDYYHDESNITKDQLPSHLQDFQSMKSILVDVRPAALDSIASFVDVVVKMPWYRYQGNTAYNPPSFFPPSAMKIAESKKIALLQVQWSNIINKCEPFKMQLKNCESDEECSKASIALQRCTGSVVCPQVVEAFDQCIEAKAGEDELDKAFKEIQRCLDSFRLDCATHLAPKKE